MEVLKMIVTIISVGFVVFVFVLMALMICINVHIKGKIKSMDEKFKRSKYDQ